MMSLDVGECLFFMVQFTTLLLAFFVLMLMQKTKKRPNYRSIG